MDETYRPGRGHDALRSAPIERPGQAARGETASGAAASGQAARGQAAPGPEVGAGADHPLLDRPFERDEITMVRHEVLARLSAAGFTGDRLQGFVLAINEVVTNVVLHAGGHGRIMLRPVGGSIWCTVTDSGPGVPQRYLSAPQVPEAFEVGGRGIWLAYQLCEEVTMATGPIGTTIGLRMSLSGSGDSSGLVNGASAAG